jgi:hypothetical protein
MGRAHASSAVSKCTDHRQDGQCDSWRASESLRFVVWRGRVFTKIGLGRADRRIRPDGCRCQMDSPQGMASTDAISLQYASCCRRYLGARTAGTKQTSVIREDRVKDAAMDSGRRRWSGRLRLSRLRVVAKQQKLFCPRGLEEQCRRGSP